MKKIVLMIVLFLFMVTNGICGVADYNKLYNPMEIKKMTENVKISVFVKYLERSDIKKLGVEDEELEFLPILPPLKYSHEKKQKEIESFNFLYKRLMELGYSPKFLIFQIRKFNDSRKHSKIEEIFTAIKNDGVRFVIDLRDSEKNIEKYSKNNRILDDFLKKNNDITLVVSTGDYGIDENLDGVIDSKTATGEFIMCKNIISVGGSENYLPIDTKFKKYEYFKTNPFKSDLIADSFNGLAAFSGRGRDKGRVPTFVSDCTAVSVGTSEVLHCGTIFAAINSLVALVEVNKYFSKSFNTPFTSSSLKKAFLIGMTKNCEPGQYGTGKYLEIKSRPDYNQGFGKLKKVSNYSPIIKYIDNRVGIRRNRFKTIDFKFKKKNSRAIVVLTYLDNGGDELVNELELIVTRSDKKIYKLEIANNFRTTKMIELTLLKNYSYEIKVKAKRTDGKRVPFALILMETR